MATHLVTLLAVLSTTLACSRPADDAPPAPSDTAAAATTPARWEGRYRLVSADGDSIPALLDRRPGCSLQLVYGALTLQADHFYFTDTTHERCEGETSRQESWIAQGTYQAAGETLRFNPDSGTAFGAAEGVLGDGEIRLRRLHTEEGTEEVDWLFVRRDRPGR